MESETLSISFKIDRELLEKIREEARKSERSLSSFLRYIIRKHFLGSENADERGSLSENGS